MAFEYVSKREVSFARNEIEKVINNVQKDLAKRGILTFQFNLVGSASNNRHLVTRIKGGNKGFDLDYNIVIQRINENYDCAKKIKFELMDAFNKFRLEEYSFCEDSSSVFTIKKIDKLNKRIVYSFDFAIVNYFEEKVKNPYFDDDYDDPDDEYYSVERQEYIKFDKNTNSYHWELRKIASGHREVEKFIKENGLWNELRDLYLAKKNARLNDKSKSIYYEALNQIFQKYLD